MDEIDKEKARYTIVHFSNLMTNEERRASR